MRKFDLSQWCDLIRGVAPDAAAREMRRELENDAAAQRSVELLDRVRRVAEHDRCLDLPDYALRVAKAAASVARPATFREDSASRRSAWRFLPFELTFDSRYQPAPTGTRNAPSSSRSLSYQAGEYTVDVRLEQDIQGRALTGQLLSSTDPVEPVAETPVLVLAGGQIVERSVTSAFGEFQAEGLPEEDLKLYVLTQLGRCIAIPLPSS